MNSEVNETQNIDCDVPEEHERNQPLWDVVNLTPQSLRPITNCFKQVQGARTCEKASTSSDVFA
jgi:hypothetical protein